MWDVCCVSEISQTFSAKTNRPQNAMELGFFFVFTYKLKVKFFCLFVCFLLLCDSMKLYRNPSLVSLLHFRLVFMLYNLSELLVHCEITSTYSQSCFKTSFLELFLKLQSPTWRAPPAGIKHVWLTCQGPCIKDVSHQFENYISNIFKVNQILMFEAVVHVQELFVCAKHNSSKMLPCNYAKETSLFLLFCA